MHVFWKRGLKRVFSAIMVCAMVLSDLELPVMAAEPESVVVVEAEPEEYAVDAVGTIEGGDQGGSSDPTSDTPSNEDGDILYHGTIEGDDERAVEWSIDVNGKLTVKGIGEFKNGFYGNPAWYEHAAQIKTAEVDLTGTTDASHMFSGCTNLQSVDLLKFDTSNVTNMSNMFARCSSLTKLDLSELDTGAVTNMYGMFYDCTNLTELNLSGMDTSEVTAMADMFHYCYSLTELNLGSFDMQKVTNVSFMFDGCSAIESLITPKHLKTYVSLPVPAMSDSDGKVYYSLPRDQDVGISLDATDPLLPAGEHVDNGSAQGIDWSIDNNGKLTVTGTGNFAGNGSQYTYWYSLSSEIRTAEIHLTGTTNASYMFSNCGNLTSVDLSGFDTREVTNMYSMFGGCSSLTELVWGDFHTESVTSMESMFHGCYNLTDLDVSSFDTGNVNYMSYMFSNCAKLTSLDLGGFDMQKVMSANNMLSSCSSIRTITTPKHLTQNVTLPVAPMRNPNDPNGEPYLSLPKNLETGIVLQVSDQKLPVSEHVDNGTAGGISWSIDTAGKLTVSGTGNFRNDFYPYWHFFADEIKSAEINLTGTTDASYMFAGCSNLTSVDLSGFNTGEVTSMHGLFEYCSKLTSVDLSGLDTSKVTGMGAIFEGCNSLAEVVWGDFNTENVTGMQSMFSNCHSLTSLDLSKFRTEKVTYMNSMFFNCHNLASLDLGSFDTGKVIQMDNMFYNCSSLTDLDIGNFDMGKVTQAEGMFRGCSSIQTLVTPKNVACYIALPLSPMVDENGNAYMSLPKDQKTGITLHVSDRKLPAGEHVDNGTAKGIDWSIDVDGNLVVSGTGEVRPGISQYSSLYWSSYVTEIKTAKIEVSGMTNAYGLFAGCTNLTEVNLEDFDGSELTNMSYMFSDCKNLTAIDLSGIDTDKVTDMSSMFYNCPKLSSVDMTGFNTGNVTNMSNMFYNCSSLESLNLSSFNTEKVTNMSQMFNSCYRLETVDVSSFNTRNVVSMENMFAYCSGLTRLDLDGFDTGKVTNIARMFTNCSTLTELDLSSFNMKKVESTADMFYGCSSIKTVQTPKNLNKYIALPVAPMRDADGNAYLSFPRNLATSISLEASTQTLPLGEHVDNGTESGIDWEIDADGKLTVTGAGEVKMGAQSYSSTAYPYWYPYRNQIRTAEIKLTDIKDVSYLFSDCYYLSSVDLSELHTDKTTNMSNMFQGCSSLTSLDLSGLNTSNVTDMSGMFRGCYGLTGLDLSAFNTGKVTNMNYMFYSCGRLESLDVDSLDISSVTGMYGMFDGCGLKTLKTFRNLKLDVALPKAMRDPEGWILSSFPKNLEEGITLSGEITLPVKEHVVNGTEQDITWSIDEDGKLTVSGTGTIKRKNVSAYSSYYTSNPLWSDYAGKISSAELHLTDAKDASYMFSNCYNLRTVDFSDFDVAAVTNVANMFNGCSSLESLDLSGFDADKLSGMDSMFGYYGYYESKIVSRMPNLRSIKVFKNLKAKVMLPALMKDEEGYNYIAFPLNLETSIELYKSDSTNGLPAKGHVNNDTDRGVDWNIDETGKLTVTGTGSFKSKVDSQYSYYGYKSDWAEFADSITAAVIDLKDIEDASYMFNEHSNLESVNLSKFDTSKVTRMDGMFEGCTSLTSIDLSGLETSLVTDMNSMFEDCVSLRSASLNGLNTSLVTSMSSMFSGCTSLRSVNLSGLNTANVTSMYDMFYGCKSLTDLDLSSFDTGKVTDMDYMFYNCASLTSLDLSGFDLSKLESWNKVFTGCTSIKTVKTFRNLTQYIELPVAPMSDEEGNLYISFPKNKEQSLVLHPSQKKVPIQEHVDNGTEQGIDWSIDEAGNLTVSGTGGIRGTGQSYPGWHACAEEIKTATINLTAVDDVYAMFMDCSNLRSIKYETLETRDIGSMRRMFYGCSSLTSVDLSDFDASNVYSMREMFYGCSSLKNVDLSVLKTGYVEDMREMFYGCSSLKSLDLSGLRIDETSTDSMLVGCTSLQTLIPAARCWNDAELPTAMEGTDGKIYYYLPTEDDFEEEEGRPEGFMLTRVDWAKKLPLGGHIDNGTVKGITWNIDVNGHLTISGTDNPDREYYWDLEESEGTRLRDMLSELQSYRGAVKTARVDLKDVKELNYLFSRYTNLRSVDLSELDTSKAIDLSGLFSKCRSLKSVDLSGLDTSKVKDMHSMFYNCSNLTEVNLNGLDTRNVENYSRMFNNCSSLPNLDLSSFVMAEYVDLGYYDEEEGYDYRMLGGCTSLKALKTFVLTGDYSGSRSLPISPMYDAAGKSYTSLSNDTSESIWLYADPSYEDIAFKSYRLTFEVNGGDDLAAPVKAVTGLSAYGELPVPVREGYTFKGWYTSKQGGQLVTENTACVGNATVYARWTETVEEQPDTPVDPKPVNPNPPVDPNPPVVPTVHTLTFDANGGSIAEALTKSVNEGAAYGALPTANREGYTFAGWYTLADGGEAVTAETICAGDAVVYAHWTENTTPDTPVDPNPPAPRNTEGMKFRFANEEAVYTYTGSAIKPQIIVTNNGELLTEGVDYSVKYSNNINANDVNAPTVTVVGKGNLTGTLSQTFTIGKKNLVDPDVVTTEVVTDNAQKAVPIICYNGMVLENRKDFTFTYSRAGEGSGATGVLTVTGTGNYSGVISVNVIEKAKSELKRFTAKTVIRDKNALVYDGTKKTVDVDVIGSGREVMVEGENYVLIYGNNVDAGTALVTVIGKGDYTGTRTLKFTIKPTDKAQVKESGLAASYPFNNKAVTIDDDLIVTDSEGKPLTQGTDYRLTYSANAKVGNAKCKVTFLGNYKATKSKTVNFQISQGELSDSNTALEIAVGDVAYTGKAGAYKSNVFVTVNGVVLKKSDYTVTYYKDEARTQETKLKANYINLADGEDSATVYVKITGKGNFAPKNAQTYATAVYKVTRNSSAVNLSKVKITVLDDNGNKLKKAEYTGYEVEPAIKVEYKDTVTKTMKTLSPEKYKVNYQNNVAKGKATIVLTGNGSDTVGNKTATFTIVSKILKSEK